MKKLSKILWGVVLVLVGGIFALNAFGITNFEVFFDGWWTLFISRNFQRARKNG